MDSNASQEDLPLNYFLLVFVLSIPFWLVGGNQLPLPIHLPISSLMVVNPLIAALVLSYRRAGSSGARELLKQAWDAQKINNKTWYLPILFLNPLIMALSYAAMRLAGLPLPDPKIPWLMAPVYFLMFFPASLAEELGWMGVAFEPMQKRWGGLKASVILGLVWALWHLIPDVQARRTANWILWHRLGTVANRVLIAWFYNKTGKSVLTATLYHDMNTVSWALFPNNGSHYNPFVTSLITCLAAAIALLGWGAKTPARRRRARA